MDTDYVGFAATRWAWAADARTSMERLVLLVLAKHADEGGEQCYPSVATMAAETRMNRKTISDCLGALVARGVVQKEARAGATNKYRLTMSENGLSENGVARKRGSPNLGDLVAQKRATTSPENGLGGSPKTGHEYRREKNNVNFSQTGTHGARREAEYFLQASNERQHNQVFPDDVNASSDV